MKNKLLKLTAMGLSISLLVLFNGCAPKTHGERLLDRIAKDREARKKFMDSINMQRIPPSIKSLEKYVSSERSKYFYTLLLQYDKNLDLIEKMRMDPKTSKSAQQKNIRDLSFARKSFLQHFSSDSRSTIMKKIKKEKKRLNAPYYAMTALPKGIDEGTLRNLPANTGQKKSIVLSLTLKYNDEMSKKDFFNAIIKDFDDLIPRESEWRKRSYGVNDLAKAMIPFVKHNIKMTEEELDALSGEPEDGILRVQQTNYLHQYKNELAMHEKKLKKGNKTRYKGISYQYMWNDGNVFIITILEDDKRVMINYSKRLRK